MIPTQKYYFDIVSDIHLEVYLAYPFRHSIWHPFGHTLWNSTWHSVSEHFACAANPLYLCISPRPWAVQTYMFYWVWYRSPVTLFAIAIAVPRGQLLEQRFHCFALFYFCSWYLLRTPTSSMWNLKLIKTERCDKSAAALFSLWGFNSVWSRPGLG